MGHNIRNSKKIITSHLSLSNTIVFLLTLPTTLSGVSSWATTKNLLDTSSYKSANVFIGNGYSRYQYLPIGQDIANITTITIYIMDTLGSSVQPTISVCDNADSSNCGIFTVQSYIPDSYITFTGSYIAAAGSTVRATLGCICGGSDGYGWYLAPGTIAGVRSPANGYILAMTATGNTLPTVYTINQNRGPISGGTQVTLTGGQFTGVTSVLFGGTSASQFTINSDTQITATVPPHIAGPVDITLVAPDGTTTNKNGFTYVDPPSISSIDPANGPLTGGTSVVIHGSNLSEASAIQFSSIYAPSFTVNNDGQITTISPAGSAGPVDVIVTTPYGTSSINAGDQFTYVVAPIISSVSPSSGPIAGGTSVTLTGNNFTGATAVKFGATNATSFTVNSATSITAVAPAGSAGIVDVTITTAGGTSSTSASDQFTYAAVPIIASVSPSSGPIAGGTSVTLTGNNFTGATAVKFGATNATSFTVNSATSITAVAPAGSAGMVDVTVTTAGGASSTSASDQFTYAAVPIIASVSPSSGPIAGGTSVTLTGNNFTGATAVKFGATNATSFTVNSATSITAVAPARSAGSVDITITTPGGTSTLTQSDLFNYVTRQVNNIVSASGGQMLSAQIVSGSAGCTIDTANTTAISTPYLNGVAPPNGGLKLVLSGCQGGETVRVSVTWPSVSGMIFRKFGKTPSSNGNSVYYTPANTNINGNTVTYDITDGGLGDDTFGVQDGIINDPAVLLPAAAADTSINTVPTLSQWALMLLAILMITLMEPRINQWLRKQWTGR